MVRAWSHVVVVVVVVVGVGVVVVIVVVDDKEGPYVWKTSSSLSREAATAMPRLSPRFVAWNE